MIRWITFGSILCFLTAVSPAGLLAQFNPYGNGANANGPGADPRMRRAWREQAVAKVGPSARNLVETYGDDAVAAIFACSRPVGLKLAEFHNSGEMAMLARPHDLLWVVAQPGCGDDVAVWAMHHHHELGDVDNFNAYVLNPLEYSLGLKPLAAGAAEARARRLNQAVMTGTAWGASLSPDQKLAIAGGAGLAVIGGIILWRRRQSAIG